MPEQGGNDRLNLMPGPQWSSVKKMLDAGEEALSSARDGAVASLTTGEGAYRLMAEEDFQALLGLAQDVRRLSTAVNDVVAAAWVANERQDEDSLQELLAVVSTVKNAPMLAVRQEHGAPVPDHEYFDEDSDGLIMDAAELRAALKR